MQVLLCIYAKAEGDFNAIKGNNITPPSKNAVPMEECWPPTHNACSNALECH